MCMYCTVQAYNMILLRPLGWYCSLVAHEDGSMQILYAHRAIRIFMHAINFRLWLILSENWFHMWNGSGCVSYCHKPQGAVVPPTSPNRALQSPECHNLKQYDNCNYPARKLFSIYCRYLQQNWSPIFRSGDICYGIRYLIRMAPIGRKRLVRSRNDQAIDFPFERGSWMSSTFYKTCIPMDVSFPFDRRTMCGEGSKCFSFLKQ